MPMSANILVFVKKSERDGTHSGSAVLIMFTSTFNGTHFIR